jgi:mono/diheme cytochrome c family protein
MHHLPSPPSTGRFAPVRPLGGALALFLLLPACAPSDGPLAPLGLSSAAEALLIGRPEQRQPLEAQLERLFGPPADPRLAPLPAPETADPSAPAGGARSGALAEALETDNARRWAEFLSDLQRQPFSKLSWPSSATPLSAATETAARADQPGWREAARAELLTSYPTLRSSARAYQRDCATCHGREGGGDGPNGAFQNPKPRDFRSGAFKHFNSQVRTRPDQTELLQVLFKGVPGTGMPSWRSRPSADLSGVADYVRYLALRGEVEAGLIAALRAGQELTDALADELYLKAWKVWQPSASAGPSATSVAPAPSESGNHR